MEWINQNWILIVFGVGLVLLMRRGGMGCGHAGGRRHGGPGHDDQHGLRDGAHPAGPTEQAIDPVSGRAVEPNRAIASFFAGQPVYFESRENRERFEAAPEQFQSSQHQPPTGSHHYG